MKAAFAIAGVTLAAAIAARSASLPQHPAPLPTDLRGTGYGSVAMTLFTPRFPLWSDGAAKRRWIALPAGKSIDKSNVDAWDFPRGTRLWKEFSFGGAIETRFIERLANGSWRYATYVWNAEGTSARLASEDGYTVQVASAPGGRYIIPSRGDCVSCHEGAPSPVLGYSAVQLGAPLAPPTAEALEAVGYLHGNCGHCHNEGALGGVGLNLAQSARDPAASYERTRESLAAVSHDALRRVRSDNPYVRMPPVGVTLPDPSAAAVIARWIRSDLNPQGEKK